MANGDDTTVGTLRMHVHLFAEMGELANTYLLAERDQTLGTDTIQIGIRERAQFVRGYLGAMLHAGDIEADIAQAYKRVLDSFCNGVATNIRV